MGNNMIIGIVCICVGALMLLWGIRKDKKYLKTKGRITGIHEHRDIDGDGFRDTMYYPQFEYEVNGEIYHGTASISYKKPNKIQIGGGIDVYYNPQKPNEYFTKGSMNFSTFLGGLAILVGIFLLVFSLNG